MRVYAGLCRMTRFAFAASAQMPIDADRWNLNVLYATDDAWSLDGTPGARERYLNVLRAGGSDYPYDLVERAGVDLAHAAPYRALAARMNAIMDSIETILAKRARS